MNILAVGAHFDDVELGCGATLKKLHDEGHMIYVYVGTTSGFASALTYNAVRTDDIARKEGALAAEMLGATLIQGDFRTFDLDYSHKLNTIITQLVEKYKIDWVFTHWIGDPHHDHWGLAMSVLHGAKHVPHVLAYRSSWYEGQEHFAPDFFVDVSDYMQFKKNLLRVFESEYHRVGEKWDIFCENTARINGLLCGCQYAEGFQCIRWLL